jgi:threonyl-tRNA synthetase
LVIGDREVENRHVAVRTRSGEDLGSMPLEDVAKLLTTEIAGRGLTVLED